MFTYERLKYLSATLIIILLGLTLRFIPSPLPDFIVKYGGDLLWATMMFFGFCFLLPAAKKNHLALAALVFSFGIEFSQLYQAAWINHIRATLFGKLVLGRGFLWLDLVSYVLGIGLGLLSVRLLEPSRRVTRMPEV